MRSSHCRHRYLMLLIMLGSTLSVAAQMKDEPLRYVDPFIGTSVSDVPTRWGNEGGCYPGAVAPSGFFQLTPETRHAATSGYDYRDSSILFFSCLHHSSGFPGGSAGSLYFMPVPAASRFNLFETRRPFRHSGETASPGYYRVRLTDDGTQVEATATARTGLFRIRFPQGSAPRIFIGDAGELKQTGDSAISGMRGFLQVKFNRPIKKTDTSTGGMILIFREEKTGDSEIVARLSASSVGAESAAANLDAEAPATLSFDTVSSRTATAWQKILSVAMINDPNVPAKTIFYTALYHSMLLPFIISDVNGLYRGHDGKIHHSSGEIEYGNFSPWDTYRTLNPLRAFLFPDREKDVALSMYDIFLQTGRLPVESMTGNHAIVILADDYAKGLLPVEKDRLYLALQSNVTDSPFVQRDMAVYTREGYLSTAWPESVTRTVEYGYDDWVLSQYAGSVMHDRLAQARYLERSFAYRKLFDPQTGLLLPKEGAGFLAHAGTTGYKEGDAWAYSFSVPQDTKGLSNLMGGDALFVRTLDSALNDGRIYFDNETVFHVPWLFNEAGAPQATQYWITRLRSERFRATPGGLPGNDDLGSTSSWFVWSALGFYPLTPGRPLYTITSPLFREVVLNPAGGKTIRILRDSTGFIIDSIRRNGKLYAGITATQQELQAGGEWYFKTRKTGFYDREEMLKVNSAGAGDSHPFSETKSGTDIQTDRLQLSKTSVRPDEPFRIRFTAVNKGAMGGASVSAFDGDELLGTTFLSIDSGQQIQSSIRCRAYRPGKRSIRIGKEQVFINVIAPSPAPEPGYRISDLRTRPLVRKNGGQRYSFRFQNTGGLKRNFNIPVLLNDREENAFRETVDAGRVINVEGTLPATKAGLNKVKVGSTRSVFRVYDSAPASLLMDLAWTAGDAASANRTTVMHDRSGFGNDGSLHSGLPRALALSPDAADAGAEGVLVGKGRYLSVESANSLDVLDSNLTLMAWIFPGRNEPGLADIISKGDHHVLQLTGAGQLSFFAGGWGRGDCTIRVPADWTGHWHHVAGVCQGRWLRLYVDGTEAGSTLTDEPVSLSNENHWNLGRNEEFPGIRMFNGRLNYVKVYADALSGPEIRQEMDRERPGK